MGSVENSIRQILLHDEDNALCCNLLLKIIFDESLEDWLWKQDLCLEIMRSQKDPNLCGLAVTCLGHIARIHERIDKETVIRELRLLEDKPYISCRIEDAISDIDMFVLIRGLFLFFL